MSAGPTPGASAACAATDEDIEHHVERSTLSVEVPRPADPLAHEPGALGHAARSLVLEVRPEVEADRTRRRERPVDHEAKGPRRDPTTACLRGKPVAEGGPVAERSGSTIANERSSSASQSRRRISTNCRASASVYGCGMGTKRAMSGSWQAANTAPASPGPQGRRVTTPSVSVTSGSLPTADLRSPVISPWAILASRPAAPPASGRAAPAGSPR